MKKDTRSTGAPVVHALRIEAEALKRAAQMVEDADLISREELVSWLKEQARESGAREACAKSIGDKHNGDAYSVMEWCYTKLAQQLEDSIPWERV